MKEKRGDIDYTLFFIIMAMVVFGMIMISSVSVYDSYRITRGQTDDPYNSFFVLRNIIHVCIGIPLFALTAKLPIKLIEKAIRPIFSVSLIMMLLVLIVGVKINGTRGWFDIPGVPFLLQPTEFLKLSVIVYLWYLFKQRQYKMRSFEEGLLPFLWVIFVIVVLVGLQPDIGTLIIILPVSLILFFVAGGDIKYILYLGIIGFLAGSCLYVVGRYDTPEERTKFSYIYDRINSFVASNKKSITEDKLHHQNKQALIAIGSGGFLGLGFGQSIQKYGYLPEPQWDFIFSIIAEELWFMGICFVMILYCTIWYRGFVIAYGTSDLFSRYVAIGVTSWILVQAFINIWVNLNSFPNTGVTLPFISYGGSSLMSLMLAGGLLVNISRQSSHTHHTTRNSLLSSKTSPEHKIFVS